MPCCATQCDAWIIHLTAMAHKQTLGVPSSSMVPVLAGWRREHRVLISVCTSDRHANAHGHELYDSPHHRNFRLTSRTHTHTHRMCSNRIAHFRFQCQPCVTAVCVCACVIPVSENKCTHTNIGVYLYKYASFNPRHNGSPPHFPLTAPARTCERPFAHTPHSALSEVFAYIFT